MLTSDDQVIAGTTYQVVLTCADREPLTLTLTSDRYALLLHAWRSLELEHGERITFNTALSLLCKTALQRFDSNSSPSRV